MDDEDKGFFILVLGVLAAILMVVSWWYSNDDVGIVAELRALDAEAAGGGFTLEPLEDSDADADAGPDTTNTADSDADAGDASAAATQDDSSDDSTDDEAATDEAAGDQAADDQAVDDEPSGPIPATVFDAIAADDQLTVLTGLLRTADLDAVLSGDGPFTVFAPTDDAVADAAASDTTVELLEQAPAAVLGYHIVPGVYTVDDLLQFVRGARAAELETVQGETLTLTLDNDALAVNGTTMLVSGSQAGNGVVHTLDNVLIPPIEALNTLVGLDPILFDIGSATIDPASYVTLDRFVELLAGTIVNVTVEGHTDNEGDAVLNQNLSQSRARSVVNYLVANGIDERRLDAEGFGPTRPVADNATEAGRALNRRIEFRLG